MNLLSTALNWTSKGFSVIPIQYRDKHPALKQWSMYQERQPTESEVRKWFPTRLHNIAIVTGFNNLVVIDFDEMWVFECWLFLFPIQTYMVKTKRGMHVYLKVDQLPTNYHSNFIDVKGKGGYVLIPPSIHPSGFEYQVFLDLPILEVEKLNDVLPEYLMPVTVHTEQPISPLPVRVEESDPWLSVEKVIDEKVVDRIREKSLLDFFPNAQPKSNDGRWFITCCPFHNDHNPSFWIDTKRGICGCYAGCTSKPLDVINLASRLYGLSNRDAIFMLAKGL